MDEDAGSPDSGGDPDATIADAGPIDAGSLDASGSAPPPWTSAIERCGNAIDDDGDGVVDGDCRPSLWPGVFVGDLAETTSLDVYETRSRRSISVLQTYRSTTAVGLSRLTTDLTLIWDHGSVPHVNVEPSGYSDAQYAAAATDPAIGTDLDMLASTLADALAARSEGRLLLTFGAEMNGNWTDWGCLPADDYIALYVRAHDAVTAALDAAGLDRRRIRWVYGPNSTSSADCGSAAGYFPGFDYVDYLGMSAYRSEGASVMDAVVRPTKRLSQDLGLTPSLRLDRLIVLQTGTGQVGGDDGDMWMRMLYSAVSGDPEFLGLVYFAAAEWSLYVDGSELDGFDGWIDGMAALPPASAGLDGTFAPYFWDVTSSHARYPEIQSLRAAGHTFGCTTSPPSFCPDDDTTGTQATALLSRAFRISETDAASLVCAATSCAADPISASALATALATLSGTTVGALVTAGHLPGCADDGSCPDEPISRADAAAWIVHVARVPSAPPF